MTHSFVLFNKQILNFQMGKKRKLSSSENEEPEVEQEEIEQEEEEEQDEDDEQEKVVTVSGTKKKRPTPGVLYLSRIPNKMNVTIIRTYFDQYGQTGRIYLQLSSKSFLFFD